jgi:methylated-DNA-[protein]-cysteine S-methyltransferase
MGRGESVMADNGTLILDTPVGPLGLGWRARGLRAVRLPGRDAAATLAAIRRRVPDAGSGEPPPWLAAAMADIVRLLGGDRVLLDAVPLDDEAVPEFEMAVYRAARTIAPGATRSYGEIARALGDPGLARAVGRALGRNPWPIVVPCHRVLAADGRPGGFSAPGGAATKFRLLEIEGAFRDRPSLPFADLPWADLPRTDRPRRL